MRGRLRSWWTLREERKGRSKYKNVGEVLTLEEIINVTRVSLAWSKLTLSLNTDCKDDMIKPANSDNKQCDPFLTQLHESHDGISLKRKHRISCLLQSNDASALLLYQRKAWKICRRTY